MKLKTLLLGSAAAMIAVTGARAADAVVAEPEPVEYVRVCDMYGTGFFYIPGTETCLRISGEIRSDYTYVDNDNAADTDSWAIRARLAFDARNETDYGTLASRIRLEGSADGAGANQVNLETATISLAGFRLGFADSFTTTFHGFGHPVDRDGGFYGFDEAVFFDYTYSANGFSAAVGIQDSLGRTPSTLVGVAPPVTVADNTIDPDYYVGVSYSAGFGTLAASYIYESRGDIRLAPSVPAIIGGTDLSRDTDISAWKISAQLTPFDGFLLEAWYAGDDGDDSRQVVGTGDYTFGVGASYSFTDNFAVRGGWSQAEFQTVNGAAGSTDVNRFEIEAAWTPVPGLQIIPNIIYDDAASTLGDERVQYGLRVYRTF